MSEHVACDGAVNPERGAAGSALTLEGLVRRVLGSGPASQGEQLRSVPGRVTKRVRFAGEDWVCKQTVRRPATDRLHDRRFHGRRFHGRRFHGRVRSAGECEFDNLLALAQHGLRVPTAVGWARVPKRGSFVVMEWVEHVGTLREVARTADAGERERLARELVTTVVQLHAAGWYHRDLYLQHWLVTADEQRALVLIDVGRVRREPAPRKRWFEKDLAALSHSVPENVPTSVRLRFFARYARLRGLEGRAQKRLWLQSIERRRQRMASHTPRWGEEETP